MPLYEIAGPDGKVYEIEGPPGASREEVIAAIQARLRAQAAAPQPPEPTVGGQIKEAVKGVVPGAIGLLETAGAGAAALLPEDYERGTRQQIQELAAAAKKPFEAAPGYEGTIGRKFGEAVGSTVPFFALGPLGVAGRVAGAGLGVGAGAGEARVRAEQEGGEAAKGEATALGAVVGATEMVPVFGFLNKLSTPIKDGIFSYVRRAAVTGGMEGAQEAAAQAAQNLIAQGLYKPEQAIIEGVAEEGAYGAGVGALIQGITDMALGRRARGATTTAQPPTEGEVPPAAPVTTDVYQMTPADRAIELSGLLQGEQTPDVLARIEELRAADVQQIEQDLARIRGTEPTTLEEQIKYQAPAQMAIREAGVEETGFLPGDEFAGPVQEPEFPTVLTPEVLDSTGLSKRSGFYKELAGKDLTDPADQQAIGEILARVRTNPSLAESTKTGLERIAMQGFGAAATQGELFVTKGKKKGEPTKEALATAPVAKEVEETVEEAPETVVSEKTLDNLRVRSKPIRESLLGKDLTKPEEAATVKETLEDFANQPNRSKESINAIEGFLSQQAFQQETGSEPVGRSGEPVGGAVEPSVPVPSVGGREAGAAGPAEPVGRGLAPVSPDVGQSDVRKGYEQRPLSPKKEEEAVAALAEYVRTTGTAEAALDLMAGEIAFETKLNRVNKAAQKALTPEQLQKLQDKVKQYRFKAKQGQKAAQRYLKYRTARPGENGNPQDVVKKLVRRMMDGWVNAPNTVVVQSITELPGYMQEQIQADGVNPKGAFDPRSENVYIIADNITGYNDLVLTVAHEAIGHYGLRAVLGGQYSKVLNTLYNSNDQVKAKADIKIKDGLDKDTAIEEVLAEAVEERVPADTMMGRAVQQLKNILRRVMQAFGVKTLNDKEVQDLLDSFSDYVVQGKGERGAGVAGRQEGMFKGEELEIMEGDAAWSPKRVNNLLGTWAYPNDEADTKAFAGFVNPQEFLDATTTAEYKPSLEKEKTALDKSKLAGEIQPIFLLMQPDFKFGFAQIIGHEGRHRMMALRDAGIQQVPVVFINGYSGQRVRDAQVQPFVRMYEEKFGDTKAQKSFVVEDLTPISYKYAAKIKQKFGQPSAQVVFRKGKQPTLTAAGQKAQQYVNALKGISNEKPKLPEKSTMEKVGAFFFDRDFRQDAVDRLRVQVSYKGASVERKLMDAFNGEVRDAMGNIRPDIFMTSSEHSDTMTVAAMKQGTIFLDKNIGWDVKKGPNSLQGAMDRIRKLGEKLGDVELAFKLANDAFIARRANALKNKPDLDISSLPDQAKIDAGLKAFKEFPELEAAFQEFTAFKNGLIDAMVQGGRLTKEQAESWKNAIDYVPWNRLQEYEESAQTSPQGYFRGLTNLRQLGKIRGGEQEINNVFDNMVGLSFWMTNNAIRNHAATQLVDTFTRMNLGVRQVREGQADVDPRKVIFIYRNGKPEYYEFDSIADVYAFKGVESVSMPILKSLAGVSNFLRKATTATPQFAISQLFQDSYRATVMSGTKSPFKTAAGVLGGFVNAYRGDPTTRRLEQLGIVGMYDLMPGRTKEEIEKEFGLKQRTTLEKAMNFMESFSIASDAALRKSIFERTLAETKSDQFPEGDVLLARYRAQEVINFKRQGASRGIGVLRQIIPFMNAYIQGMDVFYRTMTGRGIAAEERGVAFRLFVKTGMKLATLSLIYAALVGDDDEYEGLRDFEKDKNFIIPGTGMKVPVAPEVGFLFKVLPERAYNYIASQGTDRPQDATALRKAIGTAMFDAFTGPNLTPQFIKPALEVGINYSFFTNSPIVGRGLEQREPRQQFTSNTAELAKMLGDLTNISPAKMEYLVRGYTGIAGGTLIDISNMMFAGRADKNVYEQPFFKTFMYDKVPGGYKESYYDLRDRVSEVTATVNGFIADGRIDELEAYLTDDKLQLYALKKTMSKIEQQLEELRAMRKVIAADKSMDGTAKKRAIEEVEITENELLAFYNVPAMRKEIAGL